MADAVTIVAGLPIPSNSPVFLAGVGLHVLFGLAAVASGAAAMLNRKAPGPHPRFGRIYVWCLGGLAATATALASVRWREDAVLFALAVAAFAAAFVGRRARHRLWPGWPRWHIVGMGGSYIVMLTAFYVDNGPNPASLARLAGGRLLDRAGPRRPADPDLGAHPPPSRSSRAVRRLRRQPQAPAQQAAAATGSIAGATSTSSP